MPEIRTNLRYANTGVASQKEGHFEIVSLTGTFGQNRRHVHMSCSDGNSQTIFSYLTSKGQGVTFGGHVLWGNIVYTTAEIVLCVFSGVVYKRETCEKSGWEELKIYKTETPK